MDKDVLTIEEFRQVLGSLTKADLVRLRRAARIFAVGSGCEIDDLLGNAVASALSGGRKCPRTLAVVPFLVGAIRSIASSNRATAARAPNEVSLDATGTDGRSVVSLAGSTPDAEAVRLREEDYASRIAAIEEVFRDDEEALLIFWGDLEGTAKEEIMMTNDIDHIGYATIRRRMRRKMDAAFPTGWIL